MNENQIKACINLLSEVQELTLGPDWHKQDNDYAFAAISECIELSNDIQWEWWKKKKVNESNKAIELVDIMHFCFAGSLKAYYAMGISHDEAVNVIVRNYMGLPTPLILLNHGNRHIYNIKHFMYFLILDRVDYAMLKVICHDHVDSEDYLYEIFIRKAVLNKFRQLNGYKTGKYVKLWYDGAEDNVYASQIHIDLDKPLSIFLEDIAKVYTELTGNPAITSR